MCLERWSLCYFVESFIGKECDTPTDRSIEFPTFNGEHNLWTRSLRGTVFAAEQLPRDQRMSVFGMRDQSADWAEF